MGQKIAIVDDAVFMRMMISDTLAKNVHGDHRSPDGQKAFELYQVERPDLVIMDITMPNMSGIESLKAIRNYDKTRRW